jgi:hydrogenase nickel incorporation protein HypA/HybF
MHELSIALSLIETVSDELVRRGENGSVRTVWVRVGPASGVAPDALTFAFDVAVTDTALAGARLQIERAPGRELELTAVEIVDDTSDC